MNIERQERRNVLSNLGENAEMIELHDVLSWKNNTEDVSAEDIVVGEIPIENFRDRDQDKVEKFMSEICKKLKGNLDERLKTSDLIQTAHTVLTGLFDWCDMQDQGLARKVQDNLKKLINKMGLEWQENLDHSHDDLCTGYLRWVLTSKSTREQNPDTTTEKLWEKYFNKYKEDERSALFIAMFQRVQLKTYSEAIAETVGSVMTLAQARFRNLEPVNFAKEIFLRFNLPPLHVLRLAFIPSIVEKLLEYKEFHRRMEGGRDRGKLKFNNISASVGNFRAKEELNSRLPIDFFM